MKKITELRSRNLRQDRNSELVRRMRTGEQLTSFNSQSSWYPPRPIIEKDLGAIGKLYGKDAVALQDMPKNEGLTPDAENTSVASLHIAN